MARRKIGAGLTSLTLPVSVKDTSSTTGGGLSGLTSATSGLVCEYRRQGQSAWTAVTLSAGTLGTWSSGGFVADGSQAGDYELGLPDAAVASGARWVIVRLRGATNMLPVRVEIELDVVNYQSATAFITGVNSLAPPTNWNLFSLDSSGRTLLQPTQTGVTIPTVTSLTNAPADSAGVGTLLTRVPATLPTFPTNFAAFSIDASGRVTVISNADKTGYSLSASQTFNLTGNVTGNLSGSVGSVTGAVGSVTGAVGSVTGAVGSVTGNVGGNVAGSVASVTAAVTAGTVSDKGGYSLTTAEHTAISGTDVPAALTAQGYTTVRAGYLDTLNGLVAAIWAAGTRTLTGFGTLVADAAAAVWGAATRSLTDKSGFSGTATNMPSEFLSTAEQAALSAASTAAQASVAPSWWVSPDNADVATALGDLVNLLARTDPTTALTTLQTATTEIKARTDQLTFTGGNVNAAISGDATTTLYGDAGAITYTYTVYDVGGVTPLPGAAVYVSADSAGTHRSQTKVTDSLGRVTFQLDAGTVFFWMSHPDRSFGGAVSEVVS